MDIETRLHAFSDEEGLAFLEHLAHELTIQVRMIPELIHDGVINEVECRKSMYWTNEVLHNVVQMTREIRIRKEIWNGGRIMEWVQMWNGWKHAASYVQTAIIRAIECTTDC